MTDGKTTKPGDLKAFEHLLDSYGSDRTRWPAPQRLEFAGLVAGSPVAKRLYREAEAFDRLLDLAPAPASDEALLVDRIASAAFADAPEEAPRWQPAHREGAMKRSGVPSRSLMSRVSWPAASVLAASLVLGAVAGFSGALDNAMGPIVVASFEDGTGDIEVGLVALDSATSPASEEDLL